MQKSRHDWEILLAFHRQNILEQKDHRGNYKCAISLERIPKLRMVIAGTGPSEAALREKFPEAEFNGWIDHDKLPAV